MAERPNCRLDAYPEMKRFGATIIFAISHAPTFTAIGAPSSTAARDRTIRIVAAREMPAATTHAYTGSPRAQSSAEAARESKRITTWAARNSTAQAIQRYSSSYTTGADRATQPGNAPCGAM